MPNHRNAYISLATSMSKTGKFQLTPRNTTAYHALSNGSLERSYHVLKEYLKQFIENNAEWDDWIEIAMFSYNTSVHEGTKYTPYELVFGKLARLPSSDPLPEHEKMETYDMCMTKLITKLYEMRGIATQNLIEKLIHKILKSVIVYFYWKVEN